MKNAKETRQASPARTAPKPLRGQKTWQEKLLDDKDLPKIISVAPEKAQRFGGEILVIPAPREVDALMRQVPPGQLATIDDLRKALAAKHGTPTACPITTGIFAWIAAHAADEAASEGKTDITPHWRILKAKGELNPKYPGGIAALTALLEKEGHRVIQRRKRFFVDGFDQASAAMI